jgi:hypothetical protein
MTNRTSPTITGTLSAVATVAYAMFVSHITFGSIHSAPPDPVAVLVLFCVSALVCAGLVLWSPVRLFVQKKRADAAMTLAVTVVGIALLTVLWVIFVPSPFLLQ